MQDKGKIKLIAFASQKGGVGKSTIAELVAAMLYYERQIPLIVIDCDSTQDSFYKLRARDLQVVAPNTNSYSSIVSRTPYPIYKLSPESVNGSLFKLYANPEHEDIKLILFDLPGRCDQSVLELCLMVDYVISPIEADVQSLVSSLAFAITLSKAGISFPEARIKEVFLLWNKVDKRVRGTIQSWFNQEIAKQELSLLDTELPISTKYKKELMLTPIKEVFRSTLFAPPSNLRCGTNIEELTEELIRKTELI